MRKFLVLLSVLLLVVVCLGEETATNRNERRNRRKQQRDSSSSGKSSRRNTMARIQSLEEKLTQSQREISDLHGQMKTMNDRLASLGDQQSPGFQAPSEGSRLRNFPACPHRAPGFHYVAHMRKCYHLAPRETLLNWTDASTYCNSKNQKAKLVSIESPQEQEFLQKTWQVERGIASLSRFWTSGKMERGRWSWSATNRPLGYQFWIPTTEHNDDRFNCLATFSNEAYNWGDVACWAEHMVTCELDV